MVACFGMFHKGFLGRNNPRWIGHSSCCAKIKSTISFYPHGHKFSFHSNKYTLISAEKCLLHLCQIHIIIDITVHLHNTLFYTRWQLHGASTGPQGLVMYTEKRPRFGNLQIELGFHCLLLHKVPSYFIAPTRYPCTLEAGRGSFGALTWLFGVLVQLCHLLCLLVVLIVTNKTTKPACSCGMSLTQHFSVFPQWEAACQSKLNSKPHSSSDSKLITWYSSKVKQDIFFVI